MLFVVISLLLIHSSCFGSKNVGSTLFYNRITNGECWNDDDISKLTARKVFETIVLPQVTPDKITKKYIKSIIRYYRSALHLAENHKDEHSAKLFKDALSDTVGGHLRCELLPTVKFAYYAGYVPYRSVRHLNDFQNELITYLNTKGLGWSCPKAVPQLSNMTVVKILIGTGKLFNPCDSLVIKRNKDSCIHIPTPKVDDESHPTSIALPFKTGGLFSLTSPNSENILLKYYTTASRCILHGSPEECRHSDVLNFNNALCHWMKRNVAPHIVDEQVYTAYGGVFRIAAAVEKYGKDLSRRDTLTHQKPLKYPWKILSYSVCVDANWTPMLYISLVVLAATSIYFIYVCCNQIFGCKCTSVLCNVKSNKPDSVGIAYTHIESNFPAMSPRDKTTFYNAIKTDDNNSKKAPTLSTRTQKVYDLNENKEKTMHVLISDDGDTTDEESYTSKRGYENEEGYKLDSPNSAPEIDAQVAQLRITTPRGATRIRKPVFSTSTMTQSTFCQEEVSTWSVSDSSSSEDSCSTPSSKTKSCISRNSRNLAWAKRVIANHALCKSTATVLTSNSHTTTPSGP